MGRIILTGVALLALAACETDQSKLPTFISVDVAEDGTISGDYDPNTLNPEGVKDFLGKTSCKDSMLDTFKPTQRPDGRVGFIATCT